MVRRSAFALAALILGMVALVPSVARAQAVGSATVVPVQVTGPPDQRLNLVILGDNLDTERVQAELSKLMLGTFSSTHYATVTLSTTGYGDITLEHLLLSIVMEAAGDRHVPATMTLFHVSTSSSTSSAAGTPTPPSASC